MSGRSTAPTAPPVRSGMRGGMHLTMGDAKRHRPRGRRASAASPPSPAPARTMIPVRPEYQDELMDCYLWACEVINAEA